MRIVKSAAQQFASGGAQLDNVSGLRLASYLANLVAKHPRVTREDAPILLTLENDLLRHIAFKVLRAVANCKEAFVDIRGLSGYLFLVYTCDKDAVVVHVSCVVFDLDGTLTQTNPLIFASFNHVAQRFLGKTFCEEEIIALFGPPEEGALIHLLGERTGAEAMDELCAFYRAHHRELARLHEGVTDVLALLQERGISIALFTGKGHRTTRITLEAFNLTHFFDIVVTGNDVVQHKPAPEGIERIIRHCGARPEEVLMVGDSLADASASRSAGVSFAAALWDAYDRARVLAAQPDVVFHSVQEMFDWLSSHTNGFRRASPSR